MIRYNPKDWMNMVFNQYSGDIFKKLMPSLVLFTTYSVVVVVLVKHVLELSLPNTLAVHSILGIVLGLFLVFRTDSSYARWWEGRQLWGQIVNDSRNLAIKLATIIPLSEGERSYFAKAIGNFSFCLKEHLRAKADYRPLEEAREGYLKELTRAENKPVFIMKDLYTTIRKYVADGRFSGDDLIVLDKELKSLTDMVGACERIKNTPIPYSYSMYMKKFIVLFLVTFPFALVPSFGYYTPVIEALLVYILMGVELIAEEIEDPFGRDVNDLPTDDLAAKIRINVVEILQPNAS